MKRPELPEMVHVSLKIDDGWDWHDNPDWHHEEHTMPYEYLVYNGDNSYSAFSITSSEAKRKEIVKGGWLSEDILHRIESIHVIEYDILKDIESLKRKMDKYNFHPVTL